MSTQFLCAHEIGLHVAVAAPQSPGVCVCVPALQCCRHFFNRAAERICQKQLRHGLVPGKNQINDGAHSRRRRIEKEVIVIAYTGRF